MRRLALVLACLPGLAFADRTIFSPMGRKIPAGTYRLEVAFDAAETKRTQSFLTMGLTPFLELELRSESLRSDAQTGTFDLSYNHVDPVVNVTPGLSLGIRDALNRTQDGRQAYIALTLHTGLTGDLNQNVPMETTIGYATGRNRSVFAGAVMPITEKFRLLTEFDTHRVTHGLELRPIRQAAIRFLVRERQTIWSFQLSHRL